MQITKPKINGELENASGQDLFGNESVHNVLVESSVVNLPKSKATSLNESKLVKTEFNSGLYDHLQMMDVVFESCTLAGVRLPGFSAHRLVFRDCRLSGVQIYEANLHDVVFEDCKLDISNFRNTKFKNVAFVRCNLENADFMSADFTQTNLEGCSLVGADFSQSKAKSLDLRGSDLNSVKGLLSLKNATINQVQLIGLAPMLAAEIGLVVEDD